MSFGTIDDFKDKIKGGNLAKDLPFGISFHDSEITKMEMKDGNLWLTLQYGYKMPFTATLVFKNAVFKEFDLELPAKTPNIIFGFEIEENAGKFDVNIDFCVSAFEKLSFASSEICLRDVTLLPKDAK